MDATRGLTHFIEADLAHWQPIAEVVLLVKLETLLARHAEFAAFMRENPFPNDGDPED